MLSRATYYHRQKPMTNKKPPKTAKERKQDEINRKKAAGLVRINANFWVKPEDRDKVVEMLDRIKKKFMKGET
jgi:hypothetical protein